MCGDAQGLPARAWDGCDNAEATANVLRGRGIASLASDLHLGSRVVPGPVCRDPSPAEGEVGGGAVLEPFRVRNERVESQGLVRQPEARNLRRIDTEREP